MRSYAQCTAVGRSYGPGFGGADRQDIHRRRGDPGGGSRRNRRRQSRRRGRRQGPGGGAAAGKTLRGLRSPVRLRKLGVYEKTGGPGGGPGGHHCRLAAPESEPGQSRLGQTIRLQHRFHLRLVRGASAGEDEGRDDLRQPLAQVFHRGTGGLPELCGHRHL